MELRFVTILDNNLYMYYKDIPENKPDTQFQLEFKVGDSVSFQQVRFYACTNLDDSKRTGQYKTFNGSFTISQRDILFVQTIGYNKTDIVFRYIIVPGSDYSNKIDNVKLLS